MGKTTITTETAMIERLITSAAARPLVAVLLVSSAALFGILGFRDLRRDVFPDLSAPIFHVIVQNAAMGAEELETSVAIPIEAALSGLPEARRVRSTSQLGVAQVTVEFEPDADYARSRQYVAERLQSVVPLLPPGSEPPLLSSLTGRLNEVLELTLEADPGALDLMGLRDIAEFEVTRRLLAVPGVAGVERLGGYLRQFQVELDPDRLVARGVSVSEVLHALEGASDNASGGFLTQGPMEWNVRALGRASSAADLGSVVVDLRGSTPVLVSDVADVRQGPAVRRGLAHRLEGEIVSCRVVKQFGADTVGVAAGVRRAVAELQKSLPPGVKLRVAYDQSSLVEGALGGVGRAVLLGAGLVVLVLFAFLFNVRAALLVTLTIPLSVAIAGLLLDRAHVGLNTMTLGGLAIAVGLLVDASIIVVENVLHRLVGVSSLAERKRVAVRAAIEVGRPIAFTTGIIIAVFLPLFGMSGIEGRMYQPLAMAVIASMAASLIIALTLTPTLAGWLLRGADSAAEADVWLVRRLKALYRPALEACLRRPGWVRALSLGLTVPAVWLGLHVGADFMPEIDEGALLLQTVLPAEASLDQVDRLNHKVEDVLRTFPEVEDVVRRTGRSERTEDPMPHTISDVLVLLRPSRKRNMEQLMQAMRQELSLVPGVSVLFTTPLGMRIDEGLGGTPADLSVKVFGPDLNELGRLAEQAQGIMEDVRGVEDLRVETTSGLPELRISLDRPALARVGLSPGEVVQAVRTGVAGIEVGEVWQGQRRYDLVVRLSQDRRDTPSAISSLLIDGHDGTRIPLSQVAHIEQRFGPQAVRREAGQRRIAVEGSVVGRDLGGTADELRQVLRQKLELPTGYFVDVGGRVESQERATRSLTLAIGASLVLTFLLLYLALGSVLDTLVVLGTLPDALVGGIVALWLSGETWNVSSLVGLIGLFGIAVQNGLVLLSQVQALVSSGQPFEQALREASVGRLRPKVMTAMTAILGLLPLLVLDLPGTEIERPLAIVLVGGLVTSTAFTLLALPTFAALLERYRPRRQPSGPLYDE